MKVRGRECPLSAGCVTKAHTITPNVSICKPSSVLPPFFFKFNFIFLVTRSNLLFFVFTELFFAYYLRIFVSGKIMKVSTNVFFL